jgi:hypothetical protein
VRDSTLFPPALRRRPRPRRLFWLLVLSVVSGVPFPQSARAQESQTSALHGTVINSITREPVAHALVFSGDDRFAAFTDDQWLEEWRTSMVWRSVMAKAPPEQ